jgi:hypothetical protein
VNVLRASALACPISIVPTRSTAVAQGVGEQEDALI